eukprot:COSAG02_NODE_10286_length_1977_cov_7.158147_2_plen_140_part_00
MTVTQVLGTHYRTSQNASRKFSTYGATEHAILPVECMSPTRRSSCIVVFLVLLIPVMLTELCERCEHRIASGILNLILPGFGTIAAGFIADNQTMILKGLLQFGLAVSKHLPVTVPKKHTKISCVESRPCNIIDTKRWY